MPVYYIWIWEEKHNIIKRKICRVSLNDLTTCLFPKKLINCLLHAAVASCCTDSGVGEGFSWKSYSVSTKQQYHRFSHTCDMDCIVHPLRWLCSVAVVIIIISIIVLQLGGYGGSHVLFDYQGVGVPHPCGSTIGAEDWAGRQCAALFTLFHIYSTLFCFIGTEIYPPKSQWIKIVLILNVAS